MQLDFLNSWMNQESSAVTRIIYDVDDDADGVQNGHRQLNFWACSNYLFVFESSSQLVDFLRTFSPELRKKNTVFISAVENSTSAELDELFQQPIVARLRDFYVLNMATMATTTHVYKNTICTANRSQSLGYWRHPFSEMGAAQGLQNEISCKTIRATAFNAPPRSLVDASKDGNDKYGGLEV